MADSRKVQLRLDHTITLNKVVSAAHAGATSLTAILLLTYSSWPIRKYQSPAPVPDKQGQHSRQLDDSRNPIIYGRNQLANALTAWETIYLLYDTYFMINTSRKRNNLPTTLRALNFLAKESPAVLAHHVFLASAFLVLQSYIIAGKERGLWVITALMLMNSSTPMMHARSWYRQRTGKSSNVMDVSFLVAFAGARFGTVFWVLQRYGRYHDLSAIQAYRLLRRKCQVGTLMLVTLNGAWWTVLACNVVKRHLRGRKR
jgi:hypothetical protein